MSKLEKMEVTPEERELLEAVRNYNNSYPDGYPQLLWYAQELFDNLIKQPDWATIPLPSGRVLDKEHKDNPKTKMRWRQ